MPSARFDLRLDAESSSSLDASDEYEEEDDVSGESYVEDEEEDSSSDQGSRSRAPRAPCRSSAPPIGPSPSALKIVVCLERKGLGNDLIVEGGSELRPGRSIVIVGTRGATGSGHCMRVVSGAVSKRHCRVRL